MRRWILIVLMFVYPLQVALAMADRCCATTPAGISHHLAERPGAAPAGPIVAAPDAPSDAGDIHCPACAFVHVASIPTDTTVLPGKHRSSHRIASGQPFSAVPPVFRPERPQWTAAATR